MNMQDPHGRQRAGARAGTSTGASTACGWTPPQRCRRVPEGPHVRDRVGAERCSAVQCWRGTLSAPVSCPPSNRQRSGRCHAAAARAHRKQAKRKEARSWQRRLCCQTFGARTCRIHTAGGRGEGAARQADEGQARLGLHLLETYTHGYQHVPAEPPTARGAQAPPGNESQGPRRIGHQLLQTYRSPAPRKHASVV